MAKILLYLFGLLLSLPSFCLSFSCADLTRADKETCHCFEKEMNCQQNDTYLDVIVKDRQHHIIVQCASTFPNLRLDILPDVFDEPDTIFLKFTECLFDFNISDVIRKFKIGNNLIELVVDGPIPNSGLESVPDLRITKEMFGSMLENVTILSLFNVRARYDEDFLESVPNLVELRMNQDLDGPLLLSFRNLINLTYVELSRNDITVLPDRVFEPIGPTLQQLFLVKNRISRITNETFAGLVQLDTLDLRSNLIEELAADAFIDLRNLFEINLHGNRLYTISDRVFGHNPDLELVSIGRNPLVDLPERLFADLEWLQAVEVDDCRLESVPGKLFRSCSNLRKFSIRKNALTDLPEALFYNVSQITELDLSENRFEALPGGAFRHLVSLEMLHVDRNHLTTIDRFSLRGPTNLTTLTLSRNNISAIHPEAFVDVAGTLRELDLSFNRIIDATPLRSLTALVHLQIHYNQLTVIPRLTSQLLDKMDLGHNNIEYIMISDFIPFVSLRSYINLGFNQIKQVDFAKAIDLARNNTQEEPSFTSLYMQDNPINCDCSNFDLACFFNHQMSEIESFIWIDYDGFVCADAPSKSWDSLNVTEVSCPVIDGCPGPCDCFYEPLLFAVKVDCSGRNFTRYPSLTFNDPRFNRTLVNLSNNSLTSGPTPEDAGYRDVTHLDLSQNRITKIGWMPELIQEVNLSRNSIENLDREDVQMLEKRASLERLSLKDNPWMCNCDSVYLQTYVQNHTAKVNASDVLCSDSRKPLTAIELSCQNLYIVPGTVIGIAVALLVCVFFYFRYETTIRAYLYAKNLCPALIDDDDSDEDKKPYDVYISHADEDEEFVSQHLLPELEHGDCPYKVCVKFRDWIAGEAITRQVAASVRNSRRTLVVLSNHFLDDVWTKSEFRTAHTLAMNEKRTRVIIVILGDLDETKIDDDMRIYLRTRTYAKWGHRYFWRNLKSALPHSRTEAVADGAFELV